jgi:hypothetical protein
MAHTDDIDKIRYESTIERIIRYRVINHDETTRYVRETPMEEIWPAGDPVPRDRETLVEFITKEDYESGRIEISRTHEQNSSEDS